MVAIAGCSVDDRIPPGTRIPCASSTDCPASFVCSIATSHCVLPASLDKTAPTLTIVTPVAPSVGTKNTVFSVVFDASEKLSADPVVRIATKSGARAFSIDEANTVREGLRYAYRYKADGSEGSGTNTVTARLVDLEKNVADGLALGSFGLDFAAPSVSTATLTYEPNPGNPLTTVTALHDGSVARIALVTDKPLAAPPVIEAHCGQTTLHFDVDPPASVTSFTGFFLLDANVVVDDGVCTLTADLKDDVGNHATSTLTPTLAIDRTPPDAATAVNAARVKLLVVPFGAAQTGGAKGQFLVPADLSPNDNPLSKPIPAAAFAAPGETLALVLVTANGAPIGSATPASGGWTSAALTTSDPTEVSVSVVDEAGNVSGPVAVTTVEWVASLVGKVAGSTVENPTTLTETPHFSSSTLEQDFNAAVEVGDVDLAAAALPDGNGAQVVGDAPWSELVSSSVAPPVRVRAAAAFDTARGRLFLFGGAAGNDLNDTWEWDDATGVFFDRTPFGLKPPARDEPRAVYDSARGTVVVFGGLERGTSVPFSDTWEWNGDGGSWTNRTTTQTAGPRLEPAMSYDSLRDRVVLFGGLDGSTFLNDTWEWDGATGVWTDVTPSGTSPPARVAAAMSFDEARGRTVLFGGSVFGAGGANPTAFGDTWEWDGASWTQVATTGPSARTDHQMVYDSVRGNVVVFGGDGGDLASPEPDDVWEWTPAGQWLQRPQWPAANPGPRVFHSLAFDPNTGKTILFGGGTNAPATTSDLWELDGPTGSWRQRILPSTQPPTLTGAAMAYDEDTGQAVLVGGSTGNPAFGGVLNTDTWTFDPASGWQDIGGGPGGTGAAVAYDEALGQILLFGGEDGNSVANDETWLFDGQQWRFLGGTGAESVPLKPNPPAHARHAMAYDRSRGVIVMTGDAGDGFLDTWEWDGFIGKWKNRTPPQGAARPSARSGHRMAFDAARNTVLLFGGCVATGIVGDTWEWNGTLGTWTELVPDGAGPPARCQHTMVADDQRRSISLAGGFPPTGLHQALGDAWEWDGTSSTWTRITTAVLPPARIAAAAAYDENRDRFLVFGGITKAVGVDAVVQGIGGLVLGDTWQRDGATHGSPAFVWTVPFAASGLPFADVASITANTVASAPGGVDVLAWDPRRGGAWRALASAVSQNNVSTLSGADARGLLSGASNDVVVAVSAHAGNGATADGATLALDAIEARFTVDLAHATALVDHAPPPAPAAAYSHTIPTTTFGSGPNPFDDAAEGFATTTSGQRSFVSFDADDLYIGFAGTLAPVDSFGDSLEMYLGFARPTAGPALGLIAQSAFTTRFPAGFTPELHISDFNESGASISFYDGARWISVDAGAAGIAEGSFDTGIALTIPRTFFGGASAVDLLSFLAITDQRPIEGAGLFADSFVDADARELEPARFLHIDFTSPKNPNDASAEQGLQSACHEQGTASCPARSCASLLAANPTAQNGSYVLAPNGPGAPSFLALCEMTIDGGGFTQALQPYLDSLSSSTSRQYLYAANGAWYESPSTSAVWSWSSGQVGTGDYSFATSGTKATGSFTCDAPGNAETNSYGIGCVVTAGPGGLKVLMQGTPDPQDALALVCQDSPGVLGPTCQPGVSIWVRP
jgi:hypothetical protein